MNDDTQCPLLLNEILVLFPVLTIILVTVVRKKFPLMPLKKAHEYRRLSSQLNVRFAGKSLVVMRSEDRRLYS